MSSIPKKLYTEEEYLALEAQSEDRHEYYKGEIFAMAGASPAHSIICFNLAGSFFNQLSKRDCTPHGSDMAVFIQAKRHYVYPDMTVLYGDPIYTEQQRLLNPMVIIEVLSPSTEAYDRGRKFEHYRTIPSFREYLLISQDEVRVQYYQRHEIGWFFREYTALTDVVELVSIQCQLKLEDIYLKLTFASPDET